MKIRDFTWLLLAAMPPLAVGAAAGGGSFGNSTTLVDVVLNATERFQNPDHATAAGYTPMPSCVSGPEEGAMGIHFVDGNLVGDGELDAERPEALVYEAKNGRLRLVAVEYIVPVELRHQHHEAPPVLMGQHSLYVGAPHRYGGPAFYELHVWAWKFNPKGTFVDWNPRSRANSLRLRGRHTLRVISAIGSNMSLNKKDRMQPGQRALARARVVCDLTLTLGLSFLTAACNHSPTAPPPPVTVQYSLSGSVFDTAFREIVGVTVEVLEGSRAGVVAVTDERGQFQLPGVWTGSVIVRASKDGFLPTTQTYSTQSPGPQNLGFTLVLETSSPNISGTYALTFVADTQCADLPPVARSRTYTATITPGASANQYVAVVSGATFYPSRVNDRFNIGVAGLSGRVMTFDYGIGIAEELAPSTYVHIWGTADVSVQEATISGMLIGGFEYCEGSGLGPGFYRCGSKPLCARRRCIGSR